MKAEEARRLKELEIENARLKKLLPDAHPNIDMLRAAMNPNSAAPREGVSPCQNAYADSFNSRLRDDLLNQVLFADLAEAKQVTGWWQNHYNHRRPHSSLDYQPPARFAASLAEPPLGFGATPLAGNASQQAVESVPQTLIQART